MGKTVTLTLDLNLLDDLDAVIEYASMNEQDDFIEMDMDEDDFAQAEGLMGPAHDQFVEDCATKSDHIYGRCVRVFRALQAARKGQNG